ncbi:hypothetical protein [Salinimicrobium xinjiangense]|uniref:hypothetical protein n=1 Tax=Salinimicrobium xinjiangense TaxID=438596 RepID=UPI0012EB34ED|nr:hypothetical protein [Salinimicrobium xinjiangense]
MKNRITFRGITILLLMGIMLTCTPKPYFFRNNYQDANRLLHETQNLNKEYFLKAHLQNGDVYILRDTWEIDTVQNLILGTGSRFDYNRNKISEGLLSVVLDSVVIFETNKMLEKTESKRIRALAILAGVDVAVGALCLTNPKACFGSCPTFYINGEDNFHFADAEGFSNAISPSMEYFDIDALNNSRIFSNTFSLTMKNEALESHMIRNLKLLAFPRSREQRIYQSPQNEFYRCENNYLLAEVNSPEGNDPFLLKFQDRKERFSLADPDNLSSKEEIILTFDKIEDRQDLGLLINFRQTLMTTYFIYSAMGYMGDEVGDIFATMETSSATKEQLENGIKKELGDIDIYVFDKSNGSWIHQGGFYETGPVAFNRQILPLKTTAEAASIKIKIILNKGLWRIDDLALTNIREKLQPKEILPCEVFNRDMPDAIAKEEINADDQYLISMSGSEYKFLFELPAAHDDYELFLYTKGYYLEWMRESWIKDKDLLKLRQMIVNPKKYLRLEAESYKEYEQTMEEQFWDSKIDTKNFSYYGT